MSASLHVILITKATLDVIYSAGIDAVAVALSA